MILTTRRTRWPDATLGAASAAALVLATLLVPVGDRLLGIGGRPWPILCWFRRVFDLECPTCGLTRSFAASMHGDWTAAFRWHPAGPFLVLGAMTVIAMVVTLAVRRRRPLWGRSGFSHALTMAALAAIGLGLVRLVWK